MLLRDEGFAISSNLGKSLQKIRKFLVKEFKIPLLMTPVQEKETLITPLKDNQKFPLEKNIKKMFEAIKRVSQHQDQHTQNQFLSNLSLVKKKRSALPFGFKSESTKSICAFMHFNMESVQILKYMLKERDYMCKIDLKNAYSIIPIDKTCRRLVRFL